MDTLNDSLYPNGVFKTVIGAELPLALVATGANFNKAIPPRGPHRCSLRVDQRKGAGGADRGGRGHAGEQYRSAHPATTGGPSTSFFELDASSTTGQQINTADPSVPEDDVVLR